MKETLKILAEVVVFGVAFVGWMWLVGTAFGWVGMIGP